MHGPVYSLCEELVWRRRQHLGPRNAHKGTSVTDLRTRRGHCETSRGRYECRESTLVALLSRRSELESAAEPEESAQADERGGGIIRAEVGASSGYNACHRNEGWDPSVGTFKSPSHFSHFFLLIFDNVCCFCFDRGYFLNKNGLFTNVSQGQGVEVLVGLVKIVFLYFLTLTEKGLVIFFFVCKCESRSRGQTLRIEITYWKYM